MKRVVAVLAVVVGVSGCSSNGLSSLPLPAPTVGSGGYRLTAIFSNALNLPASAKVKLAGADVGQMETMVAHNYTAVTTIRIMDGVRLPQGSTAELRSATPLGDVFIALKPPPDASATTPLLKDGDTIGLDNTAAAATVESVLSSAAVMVNGGAVRNFTNVINGMGKATGDQGQAFGDIIAKTNGTLSKLTARSGQISDALTETSQLAKELDAKNQALSEVMVAAGPATDTLAANADTVSDVVLQVGDTSTQLQKFPSIAGTDTSGRSVIADANTIARSWNDLVLAPDADLRSLNRLMPPIIKATASNSFSVRASIDRLVLGSMPDAGFLGDPGFHGPKRYDWAQMVGTFKYTLWKLQQRVVGSGPGVPQVPVLPSPDQPGEVIVAPQGPPPGPPPEPAPTEPPP
ncbi:virulence factor Mce-like protein [Mycolicibacterium sp. BK556]|uniref:MlaD family protein n=1 Tax=unclassified Mycolicibacterium TaxID=2636767 RepID=UPI00161C7350|nr:MULTISPECIES: MlaD family protein [unclassified Mycolicibacterium]MBB3605343.1 virulence factor Mce-like protein [Mycolicibacterium sp. BK556]MBB3635539.1 virulence factor Mce-like protein [Mycolicibacterium sp. BK607]